MKFERQGEHHVTRNGIIPSFGSSLSIDGIDLVGQLMQQVVSLQLGCDVALPECSSQHGIPNDVVCVHRAGIVTSAGIDCEVGIHTKFQPWYRIL